MNHATCTPLRLSATETSPHKGAGAAAGGSILSATNLSSSGGGRGAAASGAAGDGGEAGAAAAGKGSLEKVDCGSLCKSLAKVRTSRPFLSLKLTWARMLSAGRVARGAAHFKNFYKEFGNSNLLFCKYLKP